MPERRIHLRLSYSAFLSVFICVHLWLRNCNKKGTGTLSTRSQSPFCYSFLAIFVFAQQLAEARVVPDGVEVVVFAHVAEIAVSQLDCHTQGTQSLVGAFQQGIASGVVIM